ncbi:MAG: hypothetical protein IJA51_02040 [Oscillospiraceae bacterium]|nr:hypothetical protein [Oscillospiraceae bacterium]
MNEEKLLSALSAVEQKAVLEADPAAPARRTAGKRVALLAACAAAVLLAVVALWPDQTKLPSVVVPSDPQQLMELPLGGAGYGGYGFEAYLLYDFSELLIADLWPGDEEGATLPVYRNTMDYDGYRPQEIDVRAMKDRARELAKAMGLRWPWGIRTNRREDGAGEKYVSSVYLEKKDIRIEVSWDMSAHVSFGQSSPYSVACDAPLDQWQTAAEELEKNLGPSLGMEEPCALVLGGDYSIYGRQGGRQFYHAYLYDAAGDAQERLINLNFFDLCVYSEGFLVHSYDLSEKVGDYPVITRKEAEELLARGNYITGCGYDMPGMDYVAGSELVYRTGLTEAYYLPYYRFYVELPQQGRPDGMKTFAAYYVPAVAAEYIADMPLWEGTNNG